MSRLRILLAEADARLCKVFKIVLFDHALVVVATIREARVALSGDPFDAVIAGWKLADGRGVDLLLELHSQKDSARRILHSAAMPSNLDELESAGVVHAFFANPSWRDLLHYLAQLRPAATLDAPGYNQRKEARGAITLSASVRCASWDIVRQLYTADLSEGGLSLFSPDLVATGTPVRIALTLPDGMRLQLRGQVRHSTPSLSMDGSVTWRIGVLLEHRDDRKRLVLRALLRSNADQNSKDAAAI